MPVKNSSLFAKTPAGQRSSSEIKASHTPVRRKTVSNDGYAFPKKKVVPPGNYRSKIVDVQDAVTNAGAQAVDVFYDLSDSGNKTYHIKQRYPLDSYYFDELCDALLDAGLPEGSRISKAKGINENVTLEYPEGSSLGSFSARCPVEDREEDEDDPEFEDFLPVDDDDDD